MEKTSATSEELGLALYYWANTGVSNLLKLLDQSQVNAAIEHATKSQDVDEAELLIVFMWAIVDLLQTEKYQPAIQAMHNAYISECKVSELYFNEVLLKRYDEYRSVFRNQKTPNYQKVAPTMAAHVMRDKSRPPINVFFIHSSLPTSLDSQTIELGKWLRQVELID